MKQKAKQSGGPSPTRVALIRYLSALAVLAVITATSFLLVRQLIDDMRKNELIVAQAADLRSEIHKTMLAIDTVVSAPSETAVLAARSQAELLRSDTDRFLLNLTSAQVGEPIWQIVRNAQNGLEPSVRALIEQAAAMRAETAAHEISPAPAPEAPMPSHGAMRGHGAPPALAAAQEHHSGGAAAHGAVPDHAQPAAAGHNPIAMKAVDDLIEALRHDARGEQERAAFTHDVLGYGTLLILLIEALIVFRPLLNRAKTEAERADQATHELEYLAAHDALTGLLNRGQIDRVLRVAVQEAASDNQQLGLILLDLDEFKPINDRYGHAAGDEVLRQVAQRIRAAVRPGDICGRLGGDEFIVMLPKLDSEPEIEAVANRVLASVAQPVHFNGQEMLPRASIGYAMFPIAGGDVEALMTAADLAMYDAKRRGRGRCSEFSQQMRSEAERTRVTEMDLRRAFQQREFELHYQLIHHAEGKILAVEALLRWRHPERGLLEPEQFLADVRRTNRAGMLTGMMLSEAVSQFAVWRAARYDLAALHVNVGREFLVDSAAREELLRLVKANGVPRSKLVLEIAEDVRFDEEIREASSFLAAAGLRVAVDRFGVGAISVEDLWSPLVDTVKLDRSIVRAAHDSAKGRSVLLALERLLRAMGKTVIALCPDGPEVEATARSAGIDVFQSDHVHRPGSAADITARLAAGPSRKERTDAA